MPLRSEEENDLEAVLRSRTAVPPDMLEKKTSPPDRLLGRRDLPGTDPSEQKTQQIL